MSRTALSVPDVIKAVQSYLVSTAIRLELTIHSFCRRVRPKSPRVCSLVASLSPGYTDYSCLHEEQQESISCRLHGKQCLTLLPALGHG